MVEKFPVYHAENAGGISDAIKERFSDNVQQFIYEAKRMIDANDFVFKKIAQDGSLNFVPSEEGYSFNMETGEVKIDITDWLWVQEHGLNVETIFWSVIHEIWHFKDLRNDPEGMMNNFKEMKRYAKNNQERVLKEWERLWDQYCIAGKHGLKAEQKGAYPKFWYVEVNGMSHAGWHVYGEIHKLFNCMDDVYVNTGVGKDLRQFRLNNDDRGAFVPELQIMYRDFLFPSDEQGKAPLKLPDGSWQSADLRKYGKSKQFVYKILRDYMVKNFDNEGLAQDTLVDPEVEAMLLSKTATGETLLEAAWKIAQPYGIYEKCNVRYSEIMKKLFPKWEELFWMDMTSLVPPLSEAPKDKPKKRSKDKRFEEFQWQPGQRVKEKNPAVGNTEPREGEVQAVDISDKGEVVTVLFDGEGEAVDFDKPRDQLILVSPESGFLEGDNVRIIQEGEHKGKIAIVKGYTQDGKLEIILQEGDGLANAGQKTMEMAKDTDKKKEITLTIENPLESLVLIDRSQFQWDMHTVVVEKGNEKAADGTVRKGEVVHVRKHVFEGKTEVTVKWEDERGHITYASPNQELLIFEEQSGPSSEGKKPKTEKTDDEPRKYQENPPKPEPGEPSWDDDISLPTQSFSEEQIEEFLKDVKEKEAKDAAKGERKKHYEGLDIKGIQSLTPDEMVDIENLDADVDPNKHLDLTDEQKNALSQRKIDLEIAQKKDLNIEIVKEYEGYETTYFDEIERVARILDPLMRKIVEMIKFIKETGFRSGKFDQRRYTKKYGQYHVSEKTLSLMDFDKIDTYQRRKMISEVNIEKKDIIIRLLIDISGSMSTNDRYKHARSMTTIIQEGLALAVNNLNAQLGLEGKKRMTMRIEVSVWDDNTAVVRKLPGLDDVDDYDEIRAKNIRSIESIVARWGNNAANSVGTLFNRALEQIGTDLNLDEASKTELQALQLDLKKLFDTTKSLKKREDIASLMQLVLKYEKKVVQTLTKLRIGNEQLVNVLKKRVDFSYVITDAGEGFESVFQTRAFIRLLKHLGVHVQGMQLDTPQMTDEVKQKINNIGALSEVEWLKALLSMDINVDLKNFIAMFSHFDEKGIFVLDGEAVVAQNLSESLLKLIEKALTTIDISVSPKV